MPRYGSPWEALAAGLGGGIQQGAPFGIQRALTLADEQRQRKQRLDDMMAQMGMQEAASLRGMVSKAGMEDVLSRDASQPEIFAGLQHIAQPEDERARREMNLSEVLGSMAEESVPNAGMLHPGQGPVGPTGPQRSFGPVQPTTLDPEQRNTMMAMSLRGRQKKQKAGGADDPESFRLQLKDAMGALGKVNPITGDIKPINETEIPALIKVLEAYRGGAPLTPAQAQALEALVGARGGQPPKKK